MTLEKTALNSANVPSFETLPFAPFLQETIRTVGYTTPTPIQADAIPLILEGSDLIGLAQTGTGKTAAFVLPLLHRLIEGKKKGVQALILAPTRELAEQINDVIKTFSGRTGVRTVTVYGGVSHRNQISQLRTNVQIVVACPGRLMDHIRGGTIDLSGVDYLILDEADRMLDMGFMPDIKAIIAKLPEQRQTLLFSATMPDEIAQLTKSYLRDPKTVRVKAEQPVASVSHSVFNLKQEEKSERLASWLRANPEALAVVFTKMKHTAKRLGDRLSKDGVPATSLHGNLSQAQRQRALQGFRDGRFRALIATDIASRGIDVEGVTHVINFDMPDTLDAYIHRTGRAGRASREGSAVSFVTRADRFMVRDIEKWLKSPMIRLNSDSESSEGEGISSDDSARSERSSRPRRAFRQDNRRGAPREGGRRRDDERGGGDRRFNDSSRRTSRGAPSGALRGASGEKRFGRQRPADQRGRSFGGQADIDPRAEYVYQERETVFIDRGSSDRSGDSARGPRRSSAGGARGRFRTEGQRDNRDKRSFRSGDRPAGRSDRSESGVGGGSFNRDRRSEGRGGAGRGAAGRGERSDYGASGERSNRSNRPSGRSGGFAGGRGERAGYGAGGGGRKRNGSGTRGSAKGSYRD